jgi:predicted negative regulator of RcsB-dependent stress response
MCAFCEVRRLYVIVCVIIIMSFLLTVGTLVGFNCFSEAVWHVTETSLLYLILT